MHRSYVYRLVVFRFFYKKKHSALPHIIRHLYYITNLILKVAIPLAQRQTPDARLADHNRRYNGHRHIVARLPDHRFVRRRRKCAAAVHHNRDAIVRGGVRQILVGVDVYQNVDADEWTGARDAVRPIAGRGLNVILFRVPIRKITISTKYIICSTNTSAESNGG